MGSFSDQQIQQISTTLGMAPDAVIAGLQAEGHAYVPGQALAEATPQVQRWPGAMDGAQAAQPMPLQVSPAEQAAFPGAQMALAPPQAAPQGAQTLIRAKGPQQPVQARPAAPGGAPSMGGGMGRIRGLFDAHQKRLSTEYDQAATAYGDAAAKLTDVQARAQGFEQQRLDAETGYAAQRATVADEIVTKQQTAIQTELAARAKEDAVLAARQAKIDQMRNDYAAARVKEPAMGAKVSGAIAIALAGIGDAFMSYGGQRGNAMQATMATVERAFDKHVQSQLEVIGRQGQALSDAQRGLQDMRAQFANDAAFRDYVKGAEMQVAAAKLDAIAAKSSNETAKIAAQEAKTLFEQRGAELMATAAGTALQDAGERMRQSADSRFATELGAAIGDRNAARSAASAAARAAAEKPPTPGVEGLTQISGTVTAKDREKAQEIATGTAGIRETVQQLQDMAARGATLDPTQRAIARRRIASLKSQFNGVFGDGTAPNEAQLRELDSLFANPTEVNLSNAGAAFGALLQDANTLTNAKLRGYGYALGGGSSDFERM